MFDSKSHTRPRCAPTRRPRRCPTLRLDGLEDRSTPTVLAVTAVADNTLYEDPAGQLSNGAGQHLYVGKTGLTAGEKVRRAVLQFDLSAVPAGSTINSAQLTLHVSRPNNGAQTVEVHRLTAAWGEGSSNAAPGGEGDGAQATTGDATWLHRFFNSQMWATPGGDFAATASASQSINAIGGYNWTGGGLSADVQQWLSNPTTNHGWILLGNESASQTAKELESRESLTAANRPTLTIDYTAPSPDLTIDKTHVGDFTQGDLADTYVITVSNVGAGPTSGTI
ncbi:MAG TPA: DNRLRE domain-containing protein, partial [Gemmataceae bacterium]|nr:DNRLRE domain-containing protein [Gemmataceae bacterium]